MNYTKKELRDTLRAFQNMKARGEFVEICNKNIPKLKRLLKTSNRPKIAKLKKTIAYAIIDRKGKLTGNNNWYGKPLNVHKTKKAAKWWLEEGDTLVEVVIKKR